MIGKRIDKKEFVNVILLFALAFSVLSATAMLVSAKDEYQPAVINYSSMYNSRGTIPDIMEGANDSLRWQPQVNIDPITGIASVFYIENNTVYGSSNFSLRYVSSTESLEKAEAWKNWSISSTVIDGYVNITGSIKGFVSTAVASDGTDYVFYSNEINPSTNTTEIYLWNSTSGSKTTIDTFNHSWYGLPGNLDTVNNIFLSLASGKVLMDKENNVLLAWSTGNGIYFKNGTGSIQAIENNTVSSALDMAIDSSNNVHIVYAKGSDFASKEIYLASSNNSFTPVQITNNSKEDCMPTIAIDSNNNIHLAWAYNVLNATHKYIIKYTKVGSNDIKEISTDLGDSTAGSTSKKITSISPKIIIPSNGMMDIFYVDTTNLKEGNSYKEDDLDIVWQHYSNLTDMADNQLTVMVMDTGKIDFSIDVDSLPNSDDIFISGMSFDPTTYFTKIRFSKIDYTAPEMSILTPDYSSIPTTGRLEIPQPSQVSIVGQANEKDIASVSAQWDGRVVSVTPDENNFTINIDNTDWLSLGEHILTIVVADEMGNELTITQEIFFTGVDITIILTVIIACAAGVGGVALGILLYKNRAKFVRRKLTKEIIPEEKKEEDWGDEEEIIEEEEDKGGDLDDETKIDLKKVDL
ncbi:MAG: hypothetical protein ACTSWN_16190 [Promethearchaeota archaeon]